MAPTSVVDHSEGHYTVEITGTDGKVHRHVNVGRRKAREALSVVNGLGAWFFKSVNVWDEDLGGYLIAGSAALK